MKTWFGVICTLLFAGTVVASDVVGQLSPHLGAMPALVVVVCDGDESGLAAIANLVEETPWKVVCRGPVSGSFSHIRKWARDKGVLGERVFIVEDDSESLWLADDMADAVWVAPGVDAARYRKEAVRVLHPGGVGMASGRVFVKPARADVDDWRHPYHSPDNNVVSQDRVARLPGELRFQTYPVFAAMPNQSLFAGGRIFFFTGHIAFHEREERSLNKLTVLNAYNGLELWSRSLDATCVVHNVSKLATDDELVFAEGKTLWMLDAATGKEIGKFAVPDDASEAGDTDWKWIAQQDGILWAAFGPPDGRVAPHREKRQMGHWPWNVANDRYLEVTNNFGAARRLAAYKYPEMERLWSVNEAEPFDARALCIDEGRIFQLAPDAFAAARDAATGEELWRQTPETSAELFKAIGRSLKRQGWGIGWATYNCTRATDGVVCIAGPSFKTTICVGMERGDLLWTSEVPSPHPFFFDDKLYVMPRVASPAVCQIMDPKTGTVLDQFSLGMIGSCTRLTVTPTQFFYRPGGGEGRTVYVDIAERRLAPYNGIVRPGCFDGVVPANGRLYWMPLACDCWQVHGTFCMAPRAALKAWIPDSGARPWDQPASAKPAAKSDWPMFRADGRATATVSAAVPRTVDQVWTAQLGTGGLTAPVCVGGQLFVGTADGTVHALDATNGELLWQLATNAAVVCPPTYWNGRVLAGSCDGTLYCADASDGRLLGRIAIAPEKRFVNIMDRFMSAWPLGGGVVVNDNGIAFTAAGSTAADGTVVAAVDIQTGAIQWRQAYTPDRADPNVSFGVQGNLLVTGDTLFINGGAPVGVVTLDSKDGQNVRVTAQREAGRDLFLEPDGTPVALGPELYSEKWTRTTIFKRHVGRAYFKTPHGTIALIAGRLFGAHDVKALDAVVDLINDATKQAGVPPNVMQVPENKPLLWAGESADVCGLAVGTDGLVVLYQDRVQGVTFDGKSIWSVALPAAPVRWGVALTAQHCIVTLTNGQVLCFEPTGLSRRDG